MTGSVALDVVIGLVFIYLLYSLLTSLIAEIIATNLGLRARNLSSALDRMLNNNNVSTFKRAKDDSGILKQIYNHPEVKSLTANKIFSRPSFIKPETFTRALLDALKHGSNTEKAKDIKDGIKSYNFDPSVEDYLLNLVEEAEGDIDKLRKSFSTWFDNTMTNASEWYKRNLQIMLFFIGLAIAWTFNVDTISITRKLSVDKEARNQLVQLASSYMESKDYQARLDSIKKLESQNGETYDLKMDSLVLVKDDLLKEINQAQTIVGGGIWLPDSIYYNKKGKLENASVINTQLVPTPQKKIKDGYQHISRSAKVNYAFRMLWKNILGYCITAIALSLGAPFWFDVLNKLMQLKSAASDKK